MQSGLYTARSKNHSLYINLVSVLRKRQHESLAGRLSRLLILALVPLGVGVSSGLSPTLLAVYTDIPIVSLYNHPMSVIYRAVRRQHNDELILTVA